MARKKIKSGILGVLPCALVQTTHRVASGPVGAWRYALLGGIVARLPRAILAGTLPVVEILRKVS